MTIQELKKHRLKRRKMSIRRKVRGTAEILRLTVFKSNKNIYAQVINDDLGVTVASASTKDKEVIGMYKDEMKKVDHSRIVGEVVAKRAKDAGVEKVVFDRNGKIYHGRVKALGDAARKAGLKF